MRHSRLAVVEACDPTNITTEEQEAVTSETVVRSRSWLFRVWRWMRPVIGVGLLGVLLWLVEWQETLAALRQARAGYVIIALLIEMLSFAPRVLRWRTLLGSQGTDLPLSRLASTYLIGSFFSNFLPSDVGGDAFRMLRVGQQTGQGADAVSSVVVERLCGMFAVLLLGVIAVLIDWGLAASAGVAVMVLLLFALFVLGIVLIFWLRRLRTRIDAVRIRWVREPLLRVARVYDSLYAFRHRQRAILAVVAFSLLFRLIGVGGLYVQSQALGLSLSPEWLAMAVSLIAVVTALPLSVNALGIKEGAFVFFFGLVSVAAPEALALALLSRVVTLAVSLLGGLLYVIGR